MFKPIDSNIRYIVDYDSERSRCSGRCDDYCRCTYITSTSVIPDVRYAYEIAQLSCTDTDSLRFYCLERMLSCILRQNPDCFEVRITNGYYGQETDGVDVNSSVLAQINTFIRKLNDPSYSTDKLVEETLIAEYGYLLPQLKDKHWQLLLPVRLECISPNNESYRGTSKSAIEQYQKHPRLSCLCRRAKSDLFLLVDGYHRYAAALANQAKEMIVISCTE